MSINHYSTDLPETLWWTQLQLQQYHHHHHHHQQQQHQQQQQSTFMEPNQNPFSSSSSSKPNLSWNPQLYHHQHHQAWLNSQNSQDPMFRNPNTPFNFNLNDENDNDEDLDDQNPTSQPQEFEQQQQQQQPDDHHENEEAAAQQKEHMFEKPLTPSDVGKLNRLVIPKQHAEKYFPLGGDSSDKGLLLSFEDESGKCWRFRYSYWNSSQSYVLTKGWSRYVKEKRLDAGDVVLFERHRTDCDRLFIGWRRRGTVAAHDSSCGGGGGGGGGGSSSGGGVVAHNSTSSACASGAVSEAWTRSFYNTHPYPTHHHHHQQEQHQHHCQLLPYQPDSCLYAAESSSSPVENQTTPVGNSKILRLFGVNLECQPEDESVPSMLPDHDHNHASSTYQHYYHHQHDYSSSVPHDHMMRDRRG